MEMFLCMAHGPSLRICSCAHVPAPHLWANCSPRIGGARLLINIHIGEGGKTLISNPPVLRENPPEQKT